MSTSTKHLIVQWVILIAVFAYLLFTKSCQGTETKTTTTKKQGKTVLLSNTTTITFDTLKWIATYKATTKPKVVYKYLKPNLTHDTTEDQPNYFYSPCDSVFNSLDIGTIQGIKYAIRDTTADNRVIGRSIKLEVPQAQITNQVLKVNDSLRVDTVYVNQKQKWGTNAKWFFRGFVVGNATGATLGIFISK